MSSVALLLDTFAIVIKIINISLWVRLYVRPNVKSQEYNGSISSIQIENFCRDPDSAPDAGNLQKINPLIVDEEVKTCDAYTLVGCPTGYICQIPSKSKHIIGVGFCCPDYGKTSTAGGKERDTNEWKSRMFWI